MHIWPGSEVVNDLEIFKNIPKYTLKKLCNKNKCVLSLPLIYVMAKMSL